jgi:hypothetical protein
MPSDLGPMAYYGIKISCSESSCVIWRGGAGPSHDTATIWGSSWTIPTTVPRGSFCLARSRSTRSPTLKRRALIGANYQNESPDAHFPIGKGRTFSYGGRLVIAAIYARKSTDHGNRNAEARPMRVGP